MRVSTTSGFTAPHSGIGLLSQRFRRSYHWTLGVRLETARCQHKRSRTRKRPESERTANYRNGLREGLPQAYERNIKKLIRVSRMEKHVFSTFSCLLLSRNFSECQRQELVSAEVCHQNQICKGSCAKAAKAVVVKQ
jgi:hypothetical protein